MEGNWVGQWSYDVLHVLWMWAFNDTEPMEKLHTQMWVCKGCTGGVGISHYVSIGFQVCNSNYSKMLTLQLDCRRTHFQHWYRNIAGNAANIELTEVAFILTPADFHGEWNVTTLILWIFALHSVQSKWKGSLPAASMQGNLEQSGLLRSLFPCPMIVKESSPCSSHSILTSGCGNVDDQTCSDCRTMEDRTCTTPSAPAAGGKCLWAEEQSRYLYL